MHIETLAVHAGTTTDPKTGAVTPPIHLSTTFERAPDGSFPGGFIYTRSGNPTRQALEACLMELEGGAAAAAFASGQAATFANLQAWSPGDHGIAHSIYLHDPNGHEIEITTYDLQAATPESK